MKRLLIALAVALFAGPALAQSSPGLVNGQTPTAAQWNAYFAAKQDFATGVITGPSSATPGHLLIWGTYPATLDGGAPPSVISGSCTTVSGAPAYSVAVQPACLAPRGYIDGLTLSTPGSVPTFTVGAGVASDHAGANLLSLTSSLTKTNASSWAVGASGGCMDTGTAAANTWYHVYLIEKTDRSVVDAICSLSASAPALPTGYSFYRYIGSMLTVSGSTNWTTFLQVGDEFRWMVPVNDVNSSALGTTATNFPLHVPLGVSVLARVRGFASSATPGTKALVSSPLTTTPVAGTPAGEVTAVAQVAGVASAFTVEVITDTSQNVTAVASAASTTLVLDTFGYLDRRGRNN